MAASSPRARVELALADRPDGGQESSAQALADAWSAVAGALDAALADAAAGQRETLRELHALAGDLITGAAARLAARAHIRAALRRLEEAGPASEIVDQAPREAADALGLDRVLLSRVADGTLILESLHLPDIKAAGVTDQRLAAPVELAYPLVEGELLRRRRSALVTVGDEEGNRHAFGEVMRWTAYVAAPVVLGGRVIAFLHGDRAEGRPPLVAADRDALEELAAGFAELLERAVLHRRLRIQRQELRQVAAWADARTGELSDGAVDLAAARRESGSDEPFRAGGGEGRLRDVLTRREIDVLEHMAQGLTNADIARELVLSEGTVKFHVKNILRKLHASNRAEATSRYHRLSRSG